MPTVQDYYNLPAQYSLEEYTTSTPEGDQQAVSYAPGYAVDLLALRQKVLSGEATGYERDWYEQQANAARAVPMRDVSTLTYNAGEDAPDRLSGGSPDLGNLMLTLVDKLEQGQATPQERALFETTYKALGDQNWRASVPQESDQFSIMGDNLLSALGVLGLGATGGLAAAPLFAGGAGLATTLGSLGTLSGIAGTGAGVLGQATDQPWLQKLGMGLGAAGGIAGGLGGLSNLWSSGVSSLGDAARLASNAGRVVGGVGAIADNDVLRQAGGWLGTAGQLGGGVDAFSNVLGGDPSTLGPGLRQLGGGVQGLLRAAQSAQQRGGQAPGQPVPRTMTDADWLRQGGRPRPVPPQSVLWNLSRR
jgi:hypothetical protein